MFVLFPRQDLSSAAPTEDQAVPCSISVSEPVSGLDSISLTVNTPGQDCSFTLTSPDAGADGAKCRRRRSGDEEIETNEIGGRRRREEEEVRKEIAAKGLGTNQLGVEDGGSKEVGDVFTCVLDQLEPGTTYELQVQSQRDEETANLTLPTSESSSSHKPVQTFTALDDTQGPLPRLFRSFFKCHTDFIHRWCSLS